VAEFLLLHDRHCGHPVQTPLMFTSDTRENGPSAPNRFNCKRQGKHSVDERGLFLFTDAERPRRLV
jgi:hypothetical protein